MTSAPTAGGSAARAALVLTAIVGLGVIAQAVLAGAFYNGAHHNAVDVHKALGPALIVPAVLAAATCAARLRSLPGGRRALAAAAGTTVALIIEAGLGFGADDHSDLLLLHVPIALGLFAMLSRQITSLAAIARPNRH